MKAATVEDIASGPFPSWSHRLLGAPSHLGSRTYAPISQSIESQVAQNTRPLHPNVAKIKTDRIAQNNGLPACQVCTVNQERTPKAPPGLLVVSMKACLGAREAAASKHADGAAQGRWQADSSQNQADLGTGRGVCMRRHVSMCVHGEEVRICICIYRCIYLFVYVRVYICTYIYICLYRPIPVHACLYAHLLFAYHIHIYIHVYVLMCIYIYTYAKAHTHVHAKVHKCLYMCAYLNQYIRTENIDMYLHIYSHAHISTCTYVHICIFTYVHIYIKTYQAMALDSV